MTNEIKNVPKLRFPEYSEEWEKKRLKDISKINPKLMNEFPSEFDYIDLESVYKGKINKVSRVTNENAPSRAQRVAQRGDVFFQTVRPYQQNNFVFLDDRYSTVVSTGYAQIRSNMNSFYIYNLLLTSTFLNKVLINCTGSNYPAINSNDLGNISIRISTNENEKQKIGEFFSKLDRQIELEEQKLAKLEEQKKGYMQKLFSQELRFKDDKGNEYPEWEEKKLGDILERGNKDKVNEIGEYRRLTISLHGKGLYEVKQERKTKDTRPFYQRFEGELIIGKQNFFNGSIAIVTSEFNGFICSNAIMSYKISNHMNRKYLLEYLLQNEFLRKNEYLADGTGQKELSEKKFEELEIKLPNSINEQQKIGVFLERLDNLIEKQSNKLELLKKRKQGLLQKMFV
ncbi:hypothetical protein BU605_07470 [Staphylococcus arlettae]|nr:restriction endonuclease subunit S [Staphylococcus arlettae]PTH26186.1 hypothetical protein BU605_07470 [Staphylococcus arlettae]